MKILWVPHTPTNVDGWEGCRQYHLLRHLGGTHDLHWITWRHGRRASDVPRWGNWASERREAGTAHTICLAPNFYRLLTRVYPKSHHLALNQRLFRRALRGICGAVDADVLVYSSSHHWTGFPPFPRRGAPIVFDYVDKSPRWVEAMYVRHSDAVVTVSEELAAEVAHYAKPTVVVPNGVDLGRYQAVRREEAKAELGLGGRLVISLIGLTCSPTLYFLDAFASLRERFAAAVLLVVGGGKVREAILRKARTLGIENVQAPGPIPNPEVHRYFAATDVGLYPGEDTPYYRQASPLKVVEYSAAGAQVVCSPVDMFRQDWPNVRLVDATAAGFERAMAAAIEDPRPPRPDLSLYDWQTLARGFEEVLRRTARRESSPAAYHGGLSR